MKLPKHKNTGYLQNLLIEHCIGGALNSDCEIRSGFKELLGQALRLEEDGLAMIGLPCTSYVFMNSGTHRRSEQLPYGDETKQYIQDANLFPSCSYSTRN